MISPKIINLSKEFISQTTELIKNYPEIFSDNDIKNYKMDIQQSLINSEPKSLIMLAGDEVLGVVVYQKDKYSHNAYSIDWLLVKEGFTNKGNGSFLIKGVSNHIRDLGGHHIYLETSNSKHNKSAQEFYEHLGFKEVGLLPDYFDHPKKKFKKLEDALIYHKAI